MKTRAIRCAALALILCHTALGDPQAQSGIASPSHAFQWTLERVQIEKRPTDGLQMADLTGDGKPELIVGANDTTVRWYQGNADGSWDSHLIATGFDEIEGIEAGDFDGDGQIEVVVLDQDGGSVYLHKADTADPTGQWRQTRLDGAAPMAQSCFVTDVSGNGKPDIIYTYDGKVAGEGGVYWLEHKGGDLLDPANWAKHEMVQINGGHGLHDGWGHFGGRRGIVASTRLLWNAAVVGEVFWLEPGSDPRQPWTRHTILAESSRKITVGDFSGNGQANDVFTIRTDRGKGIYWYEYAGDAGWIEHVVSKTGKYHMVSSHDFTGNGIPEVLVSEQGGENAVRLYQNVNGKFQLVARQPYAKTDDRITYLDITGDGRTEFVTSSDHHTLDYWKVSWTASP